MYSAKIAWKYKSAYGKIWLELNTKQGVNARARAYPLLSYNSSDT
jgi:hypothetical protein